MRKSRKTANQRVDELSDWCFARWAALDEAVRIIDEQANIRNVPLESVSMRQPPIEKYVESRCDSFCVSIQQARKEEKEFLKNKKRYEIHNITQI